MTGQANFLQSLGWAVINSLWQLAFLWVLYQVLVSAFRPVKSSIKSSLASSLLVIGFVWFLFTFFSVYTAGSGSTAASVLVVENSSVAGTWMQKILPFASVLYLCLLTIPVFRYIKNYRYVQVIRSYGLSKPAPEWRLFVNNVAARMGIRKPVHIWISEWVSSPVTIGFLKPVILVPLAAINNLGTAQMEAVLLHELAHIRRYDYLLNLVLNFIRTILYFNPFAKAFVKIVEAEREKSCDEMVLQFQYDSHQYASALLSLEKLSRQHQLLILAASGSRDLLHRVESIMGIRPKQNFSVRRAGHMLTVVAGIIALNAFLLIGKEGTNKPLSSSLAAIRANEIPSSENDSPVASMTERPSSVINTTGINNNPHLRTPQPTAAAFITALGRPDIVNASFEEDESAEEVKLEKIEEVQVKEAIEASKKVIENEQWKSVEKSLADVFSQQEKETLKSALKEEIDNFDWKKWEYKLRLAYDQVDWDNVNNQLTNALSQMKADSLVKVYSGALADLNRAQRELNRLSLQGIPDSDVSLKDLTDKQRNLQRALLHLKSTRNKKIVHL